MYKSALTFLFFLVIGTGYSQSERYVSYSNTKENALLFDQKDPFGFYQVVQKIFTRFSVEVGFQGIHYSEMPGVLKAMKKPWYEIPGMNMRLGGYSTVPLSNISGGDSLIELSDGSAQYVYPAPDSIFFSTIDYDEVVFREVEELDAETGKLVFRPRRMYFLKRFPSMKHSVVMASVDFDMFYRGDMNLMAKIDEKTAAQLIPSTEQFLADYEQHFSTTEKYPRRGEFMMIYGNWSADPMGFFSLNHLSYLDMYRKEKNKRDYSYVLREGAKNPLLVIEVQEERSTLQNVNYEDSMYVNDQGETVVAEAVYIDTLFYVKKGFTELYESWTFEYEPETKSWQKTDPGIVATMRVIPSELPMVVYSERKFDRSYIESDFDDLTSFNRYDYNVKNNPLQAYLGQLENGGFDYFDWEAALYDHKLSYKKVKNPEGE